MPREIKASRHAPSDDLGQIAEAVLELVEHHPRAGEDIHAVIMLHRPNPRLPDGQQDGHVAHHGFTSDPGGAIPEILNGIFEHAEAIARIRGLTLTVNLKRRGGG